MDVPLVTFLSDFGTQDGYVGAVKGVITTICPEARIMDITHDIPPQDVSHAAFVVRTVAKYYPLGTIHLAVVDPGVGSKRRAICVVTERYCFVGPDNGIFSPFFDTDHTVYALENPEYWRKDVSRTFHARDIFGPVAAHLAKGLPPEKLGSEIDDAVMLDSWDHEREGNRLIGSVVYIDHFGNCLTKFTPSELGQSGEFTIWMPEHPKVPEGSSMVPTYSAVPLGDGCWIVGSAGLVELAVNGGNAADLFGIERGDKVCIEFKK